jgi:hypothetical protein
MQIIVHLYRDSVYVTLETKYRPELFKDYMIQAREIATPFFLLGYHMRHASLQGGADESTKAQQRAKKGDS